MNGNGSIRSDTETPRLLRGNRVRATSVELEVAVAAANVETPAILASLQVPSHRIDVVRAHPKFTTLGTYLLDRDRLPPFGTVHHVCFELVFFVPLRPDE